MPSPLQPNPVIVRQSFFARNKVKIIWLIVALIVSASVGGFLVYQQMQYEKNLQPLSEHQDRIKVTVEKGSTAQDIGQVLQDNKVIRSAKAFSKYVTKQGLRDKLQAGDYLFSPNQSVQSIATMIANGEVDNFTITLTPGKTLAEIRASLIEAGFDETALDAALNKEYDLPLFAGKPSGQDLEGYIFPDTYRVTSQTTPEEFLAHTFDVFYQKIEASGIEASLGQRGFSLYQGITLASIVQKEADNADEQKKIAQVFELRLQKDIELGSDVTFMYASKKAGVADNLNIDSPYNTRRYKGLPPGPIANFNISALEAVANPAATDYLYFVAGDDGTIYYSHTEEEHVEYTKKYCTKLCQ